MAPIFPVPCVCFQKYSVIYGNYSCIFISHKWDSLYTHSSPCSIIISYYYFFTTTKTNKLSKTAPNHCYFKFFLLFWNSSRLTEVAKIVQSSRGPFTQLPPVPPVITSYIIHSALSKPGNWHGYNIINPKSNLIWISPVFPCNHCFVFWCIVLWNFITWMDFVTIRI